MSEVAAASLASSENQLPNTSDAVKFSSNTESAADCSSGSVLPSLRRSLHAVSQSSLRLAAMRAAEFSRSRGNDNDNDNEQAALVKDPFAQKLAGGGNVQLDRPHFVFRQIQRERKEKEKETMLKQQQLAEGSKSAPTDTATVDPEEIQPAVAPIHSTNDSSSSADVTAASATTIVDARVTAVNNESEQAPETLIRCRYIDNVITRHAQSGHCQQLVLLGAGLDSRAYRLQCLQNSAVFELDVEGVLKYKAEVLQNDNPLCRKLQRVPVDFMQEGGVAHVSKSSQTGIRAKKRAKNAKGVAVDKPESPEPNVSASSSSSSTNPPSSETTASAQPPWLSSLLAAGYDPQLSTLWVAEGLLMYLGPAQVKNILSWIALVAIRHAPLPSSPIDHHLVCDVMNENSIRSRLKWYRFFRWGCDAEHIQAFLRQCAWSVCEGDGTSTAASDKASGDKTHSIETSGQWLIHPISRDGVSYGRYLLPPLMDSTTRPRQPPMMLQSFLVQARVQRTI